MNNKDAITYISITFLVVLAIVAALGALVFGVNQAGERQKELTQACISAGKHPIIDNNRSKLLACQ